MKDEAEGVKNWSWEEDDARRFWGLTVREEEEGIAEKESEGAKGGRTSDIARGR